MHSYGPDKRKKRDSEVMLVEAPRCLNCDEKMILWIDYPKIKGDFVCIACSNKTVV